MLKRTVGILLSVVMILSGTSAAVFASVDGADEINPAENTENRMVLLDFSNPQIGFSAGVTPLAEGEGGMKNCVYWRDRKAKKDVTFKGVTRDWTGLESVTFDAYSTGISNEKITLYFYSETTPNGGAARSDWETYFYIDFVGKKTITLPVSDFANYNLVQPDKMTKIKFSASSAADPEVGLIIGSLYGNMRQGRKLEYGELSDADAAYAAANSCDTVSVMNFYSYYTADGKVYSLGDSKYKITTAADGLVLSPAVLFQEAFGAEFTQTEDGNVTLKWNGRTAVCTNVTVKNEVVYVPLCETAQQLELFARTVGQLTVIGRTAESVEKVLSDEKQTELSQRLLAERKLDPAKITKEDWREMKDKWRRYLVGDENNDLTVPGAAEIIGTVNSACKNSWERLDKDTQILRLFGPEKEPCTLSADMTAQYKHLRNMVDGYATYGSDYYHNPKLKEDVLFSLEWLYQNLYGQREIEGVGWRKTTSYNWWDWYQGTTICLTESLLLMEEDLTPALIKKYLSLFDHLALFMRTSTDTVGSRIYMGTIVAMLEEDAERLSDRVEDYNFMLMQRDSGASRITEEWLYFCHSHFAYTTGYGRSTLLDRLSLVVPLLSNTAFEVNSRYKYNLAMCMYEMFEPMMYYGHMSNVTSGRMKGSEKGYAAPLVRTLVDMIGFFGEDDDYEFKVMLKRAVTEEQRQELSAGLNLYELQILDEVLKDDSIQVPSYNKSKVYYTGDVVTHHKDGFGFALAMSSSRTGNYESINDTNKNGWYQGDGMVYTYMDNDKDQYERPYWNFVNPYRLPGTTEDTQERIEASISNTYVYESPQDFVGAVEFDKLYSTAAMQFEAFHNEAEGTMQLAGEADYGGQPPYHKCTLMAKKSWFMFDDELVALGADIHAKDGFEVNTYVENRMLNAEDTENTELGKRTVIADGQSMPSEEEWNKELKDTKYVHLENTGGYYFPAGGNMVLNKTLNTYITKAGEETKAPFFELWIEHGVSPQNGSYAYVQLPQKSAEETAAYSEKPDVEILSNTAALQAVREKKMNLTGIVFWTPGSFEDITTNQALIMMKEEKDGVCHFSVSDPTQKLTTAEIRLNGKYALTESDERISLNTENGITVLAIDFDGVNGRSLNISMTKER